MNRADSEVNYYCVASESFGFMLLPAAIFGGGSTEGLPYFILLALADKIRLFKVLQDVRYVVYCIVPYLCLGHTYWEMSERNGPMDENSSLTFSFTFSKL